MARQGNPGGLPGNTSRSQVHDLFWPVLSKVCGPSRTTAYVDRIFIAEMTGDMSRMAEDMGAISINIGTMTVSIDTMNQSIYTMNQAIGRMDGNMARMAWISISSLVQRAS